MPVLSAPAIIRFAPPSAGPDPAAAAVPLFRRLRDALAAAAPVADRWGVPPLFFFRAGLQREWEAARPPAPPVDPLLLDLADDAVTLLADSADVRKAARATPGLVAAADRVRGLASRLGELSRLLELLDDEVIRATDAATGEGWRVRVRGVADVGQFHALLADELPGQPVSPRAVAVAHGLADGPAVATARFRLLKPDADGDGPEHWLFPTQPLRSLPRTAAGERAVTLADAGRVTWEVRGTVRRVAGGLEVLAAPAGAVRAAA